MELSNERINVVIQKNEKHSLLSEWEKSFIESILKRVEKGLNLSPAQNDILQRLETKLSDSSIASQTKWTSEWDAEKQNIAQICAKYYSQAGYFSALSRRILDEPEWVVPQSAYHKMCNNKYAKKVIKEHLSEPKFAAGEAVMFRKPAVASHPKWKAFENKPLFVLTIVNEIKSAASGAKIYKVLPASSTEVLQVEERAIKKYR